MLEQFYARRADLLRARRTASRCTETSDFTDAVSFCSMHKCTGLEKFFIAVVKDTVDGQRFTVYRVRDDVRGTPLVLSSKDGAPLMVVIPVVAPDEAQPQIKDPGTSVTIRRGDVIGGADSKAKSASGGAGAVVASASATAVVALDATGQLAEALADMKAAKDQCAAPDALTKAMLSLAAFTTKESKKGYKGSAAGVEELKKVAASLVAIQGFCETAALAAETRIAEIAERENKRRDFQFMVQEEGARFGFHVINVTSEHVTFQLCDEADSRPINHVNTLLPGQAVFVDRDARVGNSCMYLNSKIVKTKDGKQEALTVTAEATAVGEKKATKTSLTIVPVIMAQQNGRVAPLLPLAEWSARDVIAVWGDNAYDFSWVSQHQDWARGGMFGWTKGAAVSRGGAMGYPIGDGGGSFGAAPAFGAASVAETIQSGSGPVMPQIINEALSRGDAGYGSDSEPVAPRAGGFGAPSAASGAAGGSFSFGAPASGARDAREALSAAALAQLQREEQLEFAASLKQKQSGSISNVVPNPAAAAAAATQAKFGREGQPKLANSLAQKQSGSISDVIPHLVSQSRTVKKSEAQMVDQSRAGHLQHGTDGKFENTTEYKGDTFAMWSKNSCCAIHLSISELVGQYTKNAKSDSSAALLEARAIAGYIKQAGGRLDWAPPANVYAAEKAEECVICGGEETAATSVGSRPELDAVAHPCGHCCMHLKCAIQFEAANGKPRPPCPLCRVPVRCFLPAKLLL